MILFLFFIGRRNQFFILIDLYYKNYIEIMFLSKQDKDKKTFIQPQSQKIARLKRQHQILQPFLVESTHQEEYFKLMTFQPQYNNFEKQQRNNQGKKKSLISENSIQKFQKNLSEHDIYWQKILKHPFEFQIQKIQHSNFGRVYTYTVLISCFHIKIYVYNYLETQIVLLTSPTCWGSYGQIFDIVDPLSKKQLIIKSIKSKNQPIQNTLKQCSFIKLFSALKIGPYYQKVFGFDLICTKEQRYFSMQKGLTLNQYYKKLFFSQKNQYKDQNQLKRMLQFMHSLNIVHLDIKPQNIVYSNIYKKLVFIDFGMSECKYINFGKKQAQFFRGSFFYCSDEMTQSYNNQASTFVDLYYNDAVCLHKTIKQIIDMKKLKKLNSFDQNFISNFNDYSLDFPKQTIKDKIYNTNLLEIKLIYLIFKKNFSQFCLFANSDSKILQYLSQRINEISQFFFQISINKQVRKIYSIFFSHKIKQQNKHILNFFSEYKDKKYYDPKIQEYQKNRIQKRKICQSFHFIHPNQKNFYLQAFQLQQVQKSQDFNSNQKSTTFLQMSGLIIFLQIKLHQLLSYQKLPNLKSEILTFLTKVLKNETKKIEQIFHEDENFPLIIKVLQFLMEKIYNKLIKFKFADFIYQFLSNNLHKIPDLIQNQKQILILKAKLYSKSNNKQQQIKSMQFADNFRLYQSYQKSFISLIQFSLVIQAKQGQNLEKYVNLGLQHTKSIQKQIVGFIFQNKIISDRTRYGIFMMAKQLLTENYKLRLKILNNIHSKSINNGDYDTAYNTLKQLQQSIEFLNSKPEISVLCEDIKQIYQLFLEYFKICTKISFAIHQHQMQKALFETISSFIQKINKDYQLPLNMQFLRCNALVSSIVFCINSFNFQKALSYLQKLQKFNYISGVNQKLKSQIFSRLKNDKITQQYAIDKNQDQNRQYNKKQSQNLDQIISTKDKNQWITFINYIKDFEKNHQKNIKINVYLLCLRNIILQFKENEINLQQKFEEYFQVLKIYIRIVQISIMNKYKGQIFTEKQIQDILFQTEKNQLFNIMKLMLFHLQNGERYKKTISKENFINSMKINSTESQSNFLEKQKFQVFQKYFLLKLKEYENFIKSKNIKQYSQNVQLFYIKFKYSLAVNSKNLKNEQVQQSLKYFNQLILENYFFLTNFQKSKQLQNSLYGNFDRLNLILQIIFQFINFNKQLCLRSSSSHKNNLLLNTQQLQKMLISIYFYLKEHKKLVFIFTLTSIAFEFAKSILLIGFKKNFQDEKKINRFIEKQILISFFEFLYKFFDKYPCQNYRRLTNYLVDLLIKQILKEFPLSKKWLVFQNLDTQNKILQHLKEFLKYIIYQADLSDKKPIIWLFFQVAKLCMKVYPIQFIKICFKICLFLERVQSSVKTAILEEFYLVLFEMNLQRNYKKAVYCLKMHVFEQKNPLKNSLRKHIILLQPLQKDKKSSNFLRFLFLLQKKLQKYQKFCK